MIWTWFIICRAADSTQNASLCQQEAKEFRRCEKVREEIKIEDILSDRMKARMETILKVAYHKRQGTRIKQPPVFLHMLVCSSKLKPKKHQHMSLPFLLLIFFLLSYFYVSLSDCLTEK